MENMIIKETIERKIYLIRGQKVMLDRDLAELYNVETYRLNEAVKRKISRFPSDFMFQLTDAEFKILISQIAISSWGGTRKAPYVFTRRGVSMLSSVLNSEQAIRVNIEIMRVFDNLELFLATHKETAEKLKELEIKVNKLSHLETKVTNHNEVIKDILEQLRRMLNQPDKPKNKIGFRKD